ILWEQETAVWIRYGLIRQVSRRLISNPLIQCAVSQRSGIFSDLSQQVIFLISCQFPMSGFKMLAYQLMGERRSGMVIQRGPPPPRGSSDPSRVITQRPGEVRL